MQNWMPETVTIIRVPTYYGARDLIDGAKLGNDEACYHGKKKEFDEPAVPVMIYQADGLRLILGSDRVDASPFAGPNAAKPDIQIERRCRGWAIFLHPEVGGDAAGVVYFHDDGRCFLMKETFSELEVVDETPKRLMAYGRRSRSSPAIPRSDFLPCRVPFCGADAGQTFARQSHHRTRRRLLGSLNSRRPTS